MGKKKKIKRPKIKVVYREKPSKDDSKEVKEEIKTLQTQRTSAPKGFFGTLQKMAINKRINEKSNYLRTKDKIKTVSRTNELLTQQIELEKKKEELKNMRKKTMMNLDEITGLPKKETVKQLSWEDIYK